MSKPRNARRTILEMIRTLRRNATAMASEWDVRGTVIDFTERDQHGNVTRRARRADEFPENNPDELRRLIEFMSAVEQNAIDIKRFAERRLGAIESERRGY